MESDYAFAYLRVSTTDQTVENQRMQIEKFAARRGVVINTEGWFEDPAVSGKVPPLKRKGFSELMDNLQAINSVGDKMPSCVLIYEMSRVGRTFWEVLEAVKSLEELSPLISTSPNEGFLQMEDKSMRRLLISILAWVAEKERENLIQRTREGVTRAKSEGQYFGKVPLGYSVIDGKLVMDTVGEKVRSMLSLNPKLKAVVLQRELNIESYNSAWKLLQSVKKFG